MQTSTVVQITPEELELLIQRSVKKILSEIQELTQKPEPDRWFTLDELCDYLPSKPSKMTVYGWVHNGTIPVHKGSKRLLFLKSEIDNWLFKPKHQSSDTPIPTIPS